MTKIETVKMLRAKINIYRRHMLYDLMKKIHLEIKNLAYHFPHVDILGTHQCGKESRELFYHIGPFQDLKFCRDYAEHSIASFTNQIQY